MQDRLVSGEVAFELFAGGQVQARPGLLGPWGVSAAAQPAGVAFTVPGGASGKVTAPQATIWRSTLPPDPDQSEAVFNQAESHIQSIQVALELSVTQVELMLKPQGGATSFSMAAEAQSSTRLESLPLSYGLPVELPPTERVKLVEEQRQFLLGIERETKGMLSYSAQLENPSGLSFDAGNEWDALSFGPLDEFSAKWGQVFQQVQDFLERLGQVAGHFAWVETNIGGQLLARTSVNWIGDLDTTWRTQPAPELIQQHERTLQLALATRIMLLRVFSAISTSAVKLSTLLAVPGGAILALPAAFNLINQIQNELERYQQIKENENGE
jgi:hypothetical protein